MGIQPHRPGGLWAAAYQRSNNSLGADCQEILVRYKGYLQSLKRAVGPLTEANFRRCASMERMPEQLAPILHVKDGYATAKWYARLGFQVEGEHRFAPTLPLYLFLRRGSQILHLSEHKGDARPNTLIYFYVDDVDEIAKEFGAEIIDQPWAGEVQLTDPDGNRWRIGKRHE